MLARHVPAPPDQRLVAFSAGTRVAVRDLFGAMPVRVKQRAAALARAGTASHLDQLLRYLVATLLACPRVLVVTLRPARGEPSVTLRTSTADLRTRLPALLAPAGLYEAGGGAAVWVPVEASGSGLSLRGCICLVPVATKKLQFILLGIRPVLSEEQPNVLYEEINRIFARSSFGVGEEAGDVVDKPLRKGIDRWPMFCMQVTAKQKYAPVAVGMHGLLDDSDTSPSLRAIIDLLRVTVYEFLKQHLFRPGPIAAHDAVGYAQVKGTKSRSASPPKSPAPIVAWHTSVSACPAAAPAPPGTADPMPASPPASTADGAAPLPKPPRAPLIDRTGMVMRPPFDVPRRAPNPAAVARSPTPAPTSPAAVEGDGPVSNTASETVVWVDPVTKIRSLIDARTGFVVNKEPKRLTLRPVLPAPDTGGGASATSPSPWLEKLLGSWENPVFERTEAPIPRVPDVAEVLGASDPTGHACCHGIKSVTVGDQSDSTIMSSLGRISRSGLAGADVVAQVDRKFILAKVPRDGQVAKTADPAASHMLVLIDQHAADERCRVEDLMRGYFPPGNPIRAATAALERPLRFDLARQEGDLLSRYQGHFAHWGIVFELFRPDEQQKHAGHGPAKKVRVDMQALPPSILERCRLEPRLLVELLRKELWRLHDGAAPAQQAVAVDAGHCEAAGTDWVARFHGCPQGILDLINSRSCRSTFSVPIRALVLCEVDGLTLCARCHHVQRRAVKGRV